MTKDFLQHDSGLSQRSVIPKPNHMKAFRLKISGSLCITDNLLGMLPAIQLHYQFLFQTDKINDVRRNGMLPAKLESTKVAVLQVEPKPQFGIG